MIEIIKKIVKREKYNSDTYIKYLRKIGVVVGENCTIYVPSKTTIDETNPFMLQIGNNVKISQGVIILTHDFSWSVTSGVFGNITGNMGEVNIGNNVFIGMNAILTKNTRIGNNVIIGAGSIVTHDCESNYVYAGSPAKKIMSINAFYEKRMIQQEEEAKEIVKKYYKTYNEYPAENILREYSFIWDNCSEDVLEDICISSGHYQKTKEYYINKKHKYKNYEDFIKNIIKEG